MNSSAPLFLPTAPVLPFSRSQPRKVATIPRLETRAFLACCVVLFLLRLIYAHSLRVDSDEPQHLHVIWGWANGLLQYRDVFDNHSPLFQMLLAPLLRALGERPDILLPLRLAMLPFFATCVWLFFKIGEALFSCRIARWLAVAAAFMPGFFLTSTEFRTDDLWVVFWFATLAICVTGRFNSLRAWAAGFTLGLAFATSMKSSLLFAVLAFAAVCVLIFRLSVGEKVAWPQLGLSLLCFACGLLIVPAAIVLFFDRAGALSNLYYCTITHNTVFGLGGRKLGAHLLRFPIAVPFLIAAAACIFRATENRRQRSLRAFVFLIAGFYVFALRSFWPLITAQDYLPFDPLVALLLMAAVCALGEFMGRRLRWPHFEKIGFPACLITEFAAIWTMHSPLNDASMRSHRAMVADVLKLTRPGEFVMDGKGETIFRPRPFYWALEGVTIARMNRGLIKDDLIERLIDTRTAVLHYTRIPPGSRPFVLQNYISVGNIMVLGTLLQPSTADANTYEFDIAIPQQYAVVGESETPAVTLDGEPFTGSRWLAAGHHVLHAEKDSGRLALLWSRAQEKGYSPFKKSPRT